MLATPSLYHKYSFQSTYVFQKYGRLFSSTFAIERNHGTKAVLLAFRQLMLRMG
jgi:hypothetical protein